MRDGELLGIPEIHVQRHANDKRVASPLNEPVRLICAQALAEIKEMSLSPC